MSRRRSRPKTTTHAVTSSGYLTQPDLPAWPPTLVAVRETIANVPRITGKPWMIAHTLPWFTIALPDGIRPGMVVEWASQPDKGLADLHFTVVTEITASAVTFAHFGSGPDGALAAACYANTRLSAGEGGLNPPGGQDDGVRVAVQDRGLKQSAAWGSSSAFGTSPI